MIGSDLSKIPQQLRADPDPRQGGRVWGFLQAIFPSERWTARPAPDKVWLEKDLYEASRQQTCLVRKLKLPFTTTLLPSLLRACSVPGLFSVPFKPSLIEPQQKLYRSTVTTILQKRKTDA